MDFLDPVNVGCGSKVHLSAERYSINADSSDLGDENLNHVLE